MAYGLAFVIFMLVIETVVVQPFETHASRWPPSAPDAAVRINVKIKDFRAPDGALRPVLRSVSFALTRGQSAPIVGPSGCRKTTLMRIIAGLEASVSGKVERIGRQKLAMVFHDIDEAVQLASRILILADTKTTLAGDFAVDRTHSDIAGLRAHIAAFQKRARIDG